MSEVNLFEDLKVWQTAADLAIEVYEITSADKVKRDYGFKDQIQRAVLSISNNIAEGYEYDNNKDLIKYLRYAKGSTGEVRSMLNIMVRIKYIDEIQYKDLHAKLIQLSRSIKSLIRYLQNFEKNKAKNFNKT
jgi:four helix bundle protein